MQGELSAQSLALEAMAADLEAARMFTSETGDRIKVRQNHLPDVLAAARHFLIRRSISSAAGFFMAGVMSAAFL